MKRASISGTALLEANWQEYAGHLLRVPRPTLKGIQQVIDSGTVGKGDIKADRLVDLSLVDELEKNRRHRRAVQGIGVTRYWREYFSGAQLD